MAQKPGLEEEIYCSFCGKSASEVKRLWLVQMAFIFVMNV